MNTDEMKTFSQIEAQNEDLEKESMEEGKSVFPFATDTPITKTLIDELDSQEVADVGAEGACCVAL